MTMEQGTQPETGKRHLLRDDFDIPNGDYRLVHAVLDEDVKKIEAERDTLRAECERLRADCDEFKKGWLAERGQRDRDRKRADAAEARVQALRKALEELGRRMRSDGPRYKSHDLGYVDSVSISTVDDWADELALLAGGEAATQETLE